MKYLISIFVILMMLSITFSGMSFSIGETSLSLFDGKTLYVGGDGAGNYTKIQYAIDDASDGDTVFVYNGTYYENIEIDISINLIGEDKETTIIDGSFIGSVVYVYAAWAFGPPLLILYLIKLKSRVRNG